MLTIEQRAEREGKLTASRVACLMSGDAKAINQLWLEMTKQAPEQEIEQTWAMALGEATEKVHLDWYEKRHGPVSQRGRVRTHPRLKDFAATLDAYDATMLAPIEVKHCGGWETVPTIIHRYYPQLQWQMMVTGTNFAVLSVILGAAEPVREIIERDDDYLLVMRERAEKFMHCVKTMQPPTDFTPEVEPNVDLVKRYDMTGNNEWGDCAETYLEERPHAVKYEQAKDSLKGLVPNDARECVGHGVKVTRSRKGVLSVREERDNGTSGET